MSQQDCPFHTFVPRFSRPFPSSLSLFVKASKCEMFVTVISSTFNMEENRYSLRVCPEPRVELEA